MQTSQGRDDLSRADESASEALEPLTDTCTLSRQSSLQLCISWIELSLLPFLHESHSCDIADNFQLHFYLSGMRK